MKSYTDLTLSEIQNIPDPVIRKKYLKDFRYSLTRIINPLYSGIKKRNFSFSKPDSEMTLKLMMAEIKDEYNSRDEIIKIIAEQYKIDARELKDIIDQKRKSKER